MRKIIITIIVSVSMLGPLQTASALKTDSSGTVTTILTGVAGIIFGALLKWDEERRIKKTVEACMRPEYHYVGALCLVKVSLFRSIHEDGGYEKVLTIGFRIKSIEASFKTKYDPKYRHGVPAGMVAMRATFVEDGLCNQHNKKWIDDYIRTGCYGDDFEIKKGALIGHSEKVLDLDKYCFLSPTQSYVCRSSDKKPIHESEEDRRKRLAIEDAADKIARAREAAKEREATSKIKEAQERIAEEARRRELERRLKSPAQDKRLRTVFIQNRRKLETALNKLTHREWAALNRMHKGTRRIGPYPGNKWFVFNFPMYLKLTPQQKYYILKHGK